MSYILDALRRAEAERERERGAVPGVHTQPAVAPDTAEQARPRQPAWWGLAAGGLLGGAVVAALWWVGRERVPATVPPPAPAALAPVPAAPAAPAAPVALAAAVAPSPTPLAVVSAPVAVASPAPPLAASASASSSAATPPVAKAAAPVAAKAQPWGALSAEQRREWPALTVGGSIYSDNASSRFVMINGQVVREGEAAAPGVTVERIGPKSAVLRFKDQRVELPF